MLSSDCTEVRRHGALRGVGAILAAAVLLLAVACNEERADPGNRRLSALQNDAALDVVVPGARLTHASSTRAQLTHVDSDESFYGGPSVHRRYSLAGDPQKVIALYAQRLPRLGWVLDSNDPAENLYLYTKEIEDWEAVLTLELDGEGGSELVLSMDAPPAIERSR